MLALRAGSVLFAAALACFALPVAPPHARGADSAAAPTLEGPGLPVFPGLSRYELRFSQPGGAPEVANVLQFSADDPQLELRPVLATEIVPGLETVPSMGAGRLAGGFVAGINGGFWLSNPVGDPNGYYAVDGTLVSESQTQGGGPRGTFAQRNDGTFLMDRLDTVVTLDASGTSRSFDVTALNRFFSSSAPYPDGEEPVYVYTRAFASEVDVRAITRDTGPLPVRAFVVDGLLPRASGRVEGPVTGVTTGPGLVAIPDGGSVVVAHGRSADDLGAVEPGDTFSVDVDPRPLFGSASAWTDIKFGIAAGPLLALDGTRVDPAGWENEGFAPQVHSNVRAPRSALGVTADRRLFLATVDGRQPDHASGMTLAELTDFMLSIGARDVLSLDGGGSSQFVTDGLLRNRPCCDTSLRAVANGLFVRHNYVFTHTERLAGEGREATAARIAEAAYPTGSDQVVLASGGNFADALSGTPLAAALGAPVLLSAVDALSPVTAASLETLAPETVTVLGGVNVISRAVEDELTGRGYSVRRIAGDGRTETAAKVAQALGDEHRSGDHPRAFLASAANFPDALSAGPPAGLLEAPVLLTTPNELSEPVRQVIRGSDVEEVVIAGGEAAIEPAVERQLEDLGVDVTRLAGQNRFGTARAINEWAEEELACSVPLPAPSPLSEGIGAGTAAPPCLDRAGLLIARGDAFPDALAGGPLAALRRHLVMIVPAIDVNSDQDAKEYLAAQSEIVTRVTLLGGHVGLSSFQQWQLDQLAR